MMEFEKELEISISNLEKSLAQNVQDRCSTMLTEVNHAFNKVLENTVSNFENLEASLGQSIADMRFILINKLIQQSIGEDCANNDNETVEHLTIHSETAKYVTNNSSDEISPELKIKILKPAKVKKEKSSSSSYSDETSIIKDVNENNAKRKHPAIHSCNYCSYATPRRYRLTQHMISKHRYAIETSDMNVVKCVYCNWECGAKWRLRGHMKRAHPDIESDTAIIENSVKFSQILSNVDANDLVENNRSIIVESIADIDANQCTICGFLFSSLIDAEKHFQNVHPEMIAAPTLKESKLPSIETENNFNAATTYLLNDCVSVQKI